MKLLAKVGIGLYGLFALITILDGTRGFFFSLGAKNWKIPDWVFILMIVSLILAFILLAFHLDNELKKKGGVPQEQFDKLKQEFADYKTGLSKSLADLDQKLRDQQKIVADAYNKTIHSKAESELEANDEVLMVLGTLAGIAVRYTQSSNLYVLYEKTFEDKRRVDFNILINELKTNSFVALAGDSHGQEIVEITSKGLKYYEAHRTREK